MSPESRRLHHHDGIVFEWICWVFEVLDVEQVDEIEFGNIEKKKKAKKCRANFSERRDNLWILDTDSNFTINSRFLQRVNTLLPSHISKPRSKRIRVLWPVNFI